MCFCAWTGWIPRCSVGFPSKRWAEFPAWPALPTEIQLIIQRSSPMATPHLHFHSPCLYVSPKSPNGLCIKRPKQTVGFNLIKAATVFQCNDNHVHQWSYWTSFIHVRYEWLIFILIFCAIWDSYLSSLTRTHIEVVLEYATLPVVPFCASRENQFCCAIFHDVKTLKWS